MAVVLPVGGGGAEERFSATPRCLACGAGAPSLTPALFSFNHPTGACPGCNGFGAVLEYDERLVVPDAQRTVAGGAIDPWTKPRYEGRRRLLKQACRDAGIAADVPWARLPAPAKRLLLHGRKGRFVGVFPFLRHLERKRYKQYIRVFLRQYQMAIECPACHGARLRPEALAVEVGGRTVGAAAALTADDLAAWLAALALGPFEREVADVVLAETDAAARRAARRRGRLPHPRSPDAHPLGGRGAAHLARQRARRQAHRDALRPRRADDRPAPAGHRPAARRCCGASPTRGNTVLTVEHDPAAIRAADWVVELGPASGEHGGNVVFEGTVADLARAADADRPVPRRRPAHRRAVGAAPRGTQVAHRSRARRPTTSTASASASPSARSPP